jgi:hypothetical protein
VQLLAQHLLGIETPNTSRRCTIPASVRDIQSRRAHVLLSSVISIHACLFAGGCSSQRDYLLCKLRMSRMSYFMLACLLARLPACLQLAARLPAGQAARGCGQFHLNVCMIHSPGSRMC